MLKSNGNVIVTAQANNEKGFVLVAALMILVLLVAVSTIVFYVATKDLRISGRIAGEKKAFAGVEAGIGQLKLFSNMNGGMIGNYVVNQAQVDAATDPNTLYSITAFTGPATSFPATRDMVGYSITGGQQWKQKVTAKSVVGENTAYQTRVTVDVGVGYGPVDISTLYR